MLPIAILIAALPGVLGVPLGIFNPSSNSSIVPGKYVVTLKPNVEPSVLTSHLHNVKAIHARGINTRDEQGVDKVWTKNFKGYSGEFDDDTIRQILKSDDVSQPLSIPYPRMESLLDW